MGLLSIAKLALYGIFLNYYCYFVITGHFIPYGTVLFFGVAFGCVGLSMLKDRLVWVGDEVRCWLLYIALSFATMFFALNTDYAFDSIMKFLQRLIIIIMIVYICERENSIKFAVRLLAINAMACACAVLYTIDDIQLKLDLSSGANLSANDTGALMAFGCFAMLFVFEKRKRVSFFATVIQFASIITMISVIFIAGSRKSIYAIVILLVLLLVLCGKDYLKNSSLGKALVFIIIGIFAFYFVSNNLFPYIEDTNLYARIWGRGAESASSSDASRMWLYIAALKDFLAHPIAGLGFNNFTVAHGVYTHSTYVEPLACSGLIGILYLIPYVKIFRRQIELIKMNRENPIEFMKQKELFAFYIMFLFIGVGIPYIYKDNPCIILALFIASQCISYRKLNQEREEKESLHDGQKKA